MGRHAPAAGAPGSLCSAHTCPRTIRLSVNAKGDSSGGVLSCAAVSSHMHLRSACDRFLPGQCLSSVHAQALAEPLPQMPGPCGERWSVKLKYCPVTGALLDTRHSWEASLPRIDDIRDAFSKEQLPPPAPRAWCGRGPPFKWLQFPSAVCSKFCLPYHAHIFRSLQGIPYLRRYHKQNDEIDCRHSFVAYTLAHHPFAAPPALTPGLRRPARTCCAVARPPLPTLRRDPSCSALTRTQSAGRAAATTTFGGGRRRQRALATCNLHR
jgi:hypothetical protein